MASINQNAYSSALPDFRNLGVLLRIIVGVNLCALAAALVDASSFAHFAERATTAAAWVQPLLVASLLLLALVDRPLRRLSYRAGVLAVLVLEVVLAFAFHRVLSVLPGVELPPVGRLLALTALVTAVLGVYFDLRGRALSPALSEARLQALQARIRPHFLYNSINAVLSLIRAEPRRAEAALEDLASLFRVLMADNRELTPLAHELELARQYLDLEQLRLGDRLRIAWHVDKMPQDALVPPLVLQPLLENAVYHGIEPRAEPDTIAVDIYARRDVVHVRLRNPYEPEGRHHGGNKMALANIRERLALHFDAEATLDTRVGDGCYEVRIALPYVRERAR